MPPRCSCSMCSWKSLFACLGESGRLDALLQRAWMSPSPSKKRKLTTDTLTKQQEVIKELEEELNESISSSASLNSLNSLIQFLRKLSNPHDVHKGIWSLYRIFLKLIQEKRIFGAASSESSDGQPSSAEMKKVQRWLTQKFGDYSTYLISLLQDNEHALRSSSIQITMDLLEVTSSAVSLARGQPQLYMLLWRNFVEALLKCQPSLRLNCINDDHEELYSDVKETFVDKYLNKYDDIRWFFLRDAPKCLQANSGADRPSLSLLSFLELLRGTFSESSSPRKFLIPHFASENIRAESDDNPDEDIGDDWRIAFREVGSGQSGMEPMEQRRTERSCQLSTARALRSANSHRTQFTNCWFILLPHLKGSEAGSIRVLNIMQNDIMPYLNRPVRLHDWVAGCVEYGGPAGLLALNTLFILMQQHHLDYPAFYPQLYKFLTSDLLHLKFRSRFFRLAELFLGSTHLPAIMIASFLKRLSRLSLGAPPAAIVLLIPFTYNLLKKHPSLMVMIHRHEVALEGDPFKMDESNPYLTNAIDSSLWELTSHRSHYHHNVATLARVFEEKFTKPHFGLEDFLDHTYSTMFSMEMKSKMRSEPPLAIDISSQLFIEPRVSSETSKPTLDPVGELWVF